MSVYHGKFYRKAEHREGKAVPFSLIVLSFFAIELFSFFFLSLTEEFHSSQLWPLAFGGLWAVILSGIVRMLPGKAARVAFGILYFSAAVYSGFQTGYFILFSQMMWLSDFRYASEGADYADMLLTYPAGWWLGIVGMILLGERPGLQFYLGLAIMAAATVLMVKDTVVLQHSHEHTHVHCHEHRHGELVHTHEHAHTHTHTHVHGEDESAHGHTHEEIQGHEHVHSEELKTK